MTANSQAPADRAIEAARWGSYWSIVGAQLRKNRTAMAAWWLLRGLLVLAVAAPLVAFNVPILWRDASGWSTPLLSALFDRFLFAGGVDVFFNLLLVAGPVWLLVGKTLVGYRAWREGTTRRGFWVPAASLGLVLAVLVFAAFGARTAMWFALGAIVLPGAGILAWAYGPGRALPQLVKRARYACLAVFMIGFGALVIYLPETLPVRDWHAAAAAQTDAPSVAVFPPIPFHFDNVGERAVLDSSGEGVPRAKNLLGRDPSQHDVAARLIFGTRISLTIGLVAVSIYILIGTILGGLAGFYGGWVDLLISRMIEVMICFPTLFLLLTIIAVFETRSIFLIMGAIGLVGWPGVARLVRGEFLRQRNLDYVTAAHAQGIPERRIIFGHVLPNCIGPVLVSATFGIAGAILIESTLAFLGLGDPSAASWGDLLTKGRTEQDWMLILAPGFAIFFVVTVFNLLGEGLRDALDPKLRR